MNWTAYLSLFEEIIKGEIKGKPYDDPAYVELVKLNYSRIKRWGKSVELTQEILESVEHIDSKQQWIFIAEPWCNDASNSAPIIQKIADSSPLINLEILLRDSPPFLINDYLTDGNKAIPILIVRNEKGDDLFTWGPRPDSCQKFAQTLKLMDLTSSEKKVQIQKWYNQDKGNSIQREISSLEQHLHSENLISH